MVWQFIIVLMRALKCLKKYPRIFWMPLSPGRKALSLYSLVRAKVYIQKAIQRQHCGDAWCLESQNSAMQCRAPTAGHCAGGGYREQHPPCALLRLTLSKEPLQVANRETLQTGTDFNSVLNGPCVVRRVNGRCLPLFKSKSQPVGKQPKLQHRAEVSSHALQKLTSGQSTVAWSTFAVTWEVAYCYSPWPFKTGRNGLCPSLFLWKAPKLANNRHMPSRLLRHPVQQKDRCSRTKGEQVAIYTRCVEDEEGWLSTFTLIPWALEAAQLKKPLSRNIAPCRGSNIPFHPEANLGVQGLHMLCGQRRKGLGILGFNHCSGHQFVMLSDFPQVIKMGCSGIYTG